MIRKLAFKLLILGLACVALHGCGGSSSPTSSSPTASTPVRSFPAGTTFTVVSGETGQPVASARFVVGGEDLLTNEDGQVRLSGDVQFGDRLDIVATGFLDRQTTFWKGRTRYTLWPKTSPTGLTEHATGEIVYTSSYLSDDNPEFGQQGLSRWQEGLSEIVVVFGKGFEKGARTTKMQIEAVAEFNRTIPNGISYTSPRFVTPPSRGYVELRIDPDYSSCVEYGSKAVAVLPRGEYTSSRITYCYEDAALSKTTALHELGHTFGLRHSSDTIDSMHNPAIWPRFSPRERLLMKLMMLRRGGNLFPDNDREATRPPVGESTLFLCYE